MTDGPKPIAEAPTDGTMILVGWFGSSHMCRALWDGTAWMGLFPDPENRLHGTAIALKDAPDVWWPCPTARVWPTAA